jgi:hypothetical protein
VSSCLKNDYGMTFSVSPHSSGALPLFRKIESFIAATIARSPCGVESELQAGFKDEVVSHCQNNF